MGKIFMSEEKIRSIANKKIRSMYIPASVYRLQMTRELGFKKARTLVSYLRKLGIEAVYTSPFFQSSPGSAHGYDVTDPGRINREIGAEKDFDRFCQALESNGLGLIADVVPNHMGITGNNNPWWTDVLENGPSSLYADFFDIDWTPTKKELTDKVLLPFLGYYYGAVLEKGELKLAFEGGGFCLYYYDHCFPIDPKTYTEILELRFDEMRQASWATGGVVNEYMSIVTAFRNLPPKSSREPRLREERAREKEIAKKRLEKLCSNSGELRSFLLGTVKLFNGRVGDHASFDRLNELLDKQNYRLSYWRVASEEINYRRFFDINELAAIRIEDESVLRAHHRLLFELMGEGRIKGVRLDHPDGLYDPPEYFRRIQHEFLFRAVLKEVTEHYVVAEESGWIDEAAIHATIDKMFEEGYETARPFYAVAEKILDRQEKLPEDWNIHGTVGYDFLNAMNGLFVDSTADKKFAVLYENFIGHNIDFEELVYSKKKSFALVQMASEINSLGYRLDQISESNRLTRDFTRNNLTLAIREMIACFSVYRTYILSDARSASERDEKYIRMAAEMAKKKTPLLNPQVYDFLRDVMLLRADLCGDPKELSMYKDFVMRLQQLTGPIMAKGVEDTSFYIYNRLISLNEVGGDPFHFGWEQGEFHAFNLDRNKRWPFGMITTSTHDTKRSEDVRSRINVLSEIPEEWGKIIKKWADINKGLKTVVKGTAEPRANTEYLIYQTLLGIWPDTPPGKADAGEFHTRIQNYVLKAVREAKIYTNWTDPNVDYENAVKNFLGGIFKGKAKDPFWKTFNEFHEKISWCGRMNSLSALTIKIGAPGVVDTYQGAEFFDLSLVDPDNRRPVDFSSRMRKLEEIIQMRKEKGEEHIIKKCMRHGGWDELKMFILWKGLNIRKKNHDLFLGGDYIPLNVRGPKAGNIIAFARKKGKKTAIFVSARFFSGLLPGRVRTWFENEIWEGTEIIIPDEIGEVVSHDAYSRKKIAAVRGEKDIFLRAADIFASLPTAILIDQRSADE